MNAGLKIKLLRMAALAYALFGPVRWFLFTSHPLGEIVSTEGGKTIRTVASDPLMLAWGVGGLLLYLLLAFTKPRPIRDGIPRARRRLAGHLIDLVFFVLVFSALGSFVPIFREAIRTGHFAWSYQQSSVSSSDVSAVEVLVMIPASLAMMALFIWYAALPLTKCGQTVGGFIVGVRIVSPFGYELRMKSYDAFRRAFWEFRWLASGGGKVISITDPDVMRWETPAVLVADE